MGRLPAAMVGGPLLRRRSRRGKPRVPEEIKIWFLTFSLKLKVVFRQVTEINPWDSRVAETLRNLSEPVVSIDHGFFYDYSMMKKMKGGRNMSFKRVCKFYDHSRCLLNNNFCDLDCTRISDERGFGPDEARRSIKKWRNEELDEEIRKIGLRLK